MARLGGEAASGVWEYFKDISRLDYEIFCEIFLRAGAKFCELLFKEV